MKNNANIVAIVVLLLGACSFGNNTTQDHIATAPKPAYDTTLVKGKIIDSVVCTNQTDQSYALYLPTYYNPNKAYPCIYFLDAHANGALPLRKYKELAEMYGFVFVGSNNSKNGTASQATSNMVKTLMADTRNRINIDPQRIYTSGFSGGARNASAVAVFDGGVAGVIGCAAGFPQVEQDMQYKFDYFGIVGTIDFNLIDLEQLDANLQQIGFAHQLLTFFGKHTWAAKNDYQTALLWMQANAMKKNLQPKNDTLINALKADYNQRIAIALNTHETIQQHILLAGLISTLSGLTDITAYKKQLDVLTASSAYKNEIAQQVKRQETEISLQHEVAQQFTQQDAQWWTVKIATINKNIKTATTPKEALMYQRLLNYCGLIGYMSANRAINSGDLDKATLFLKIFKLADPQNPDCNFLEALYYMKKGNPQQAIASLSEAAAIGYSDVPQLYTNPLLESVLQDTGFIKVVNKVRQNAKE